MCWTDSVDSLAVFGPCPISCCYRVTGQFTWQQYCEYPVLHKPYVALLPIIMLTTGNGQNSIYTLHIFRFYRPKTPIQQLVPVVDQNINVRINIKHSWECKGIMEFVEKLFRKSIGDVVLIRCTRNYKLINDL